MQECPCTKAHRFDQIRRLFREPLEWYEKNKDDEGLIYDEAVIEFTKLSRGHYQEFLKLLSDHL